MGRGRGDVKYRDAVDVGTLIFIAVLIWADRPTRLRNTWFGFLAFVIFLLLRVCL